MREQRPVCIYNDHFAKTGSGHIGKTPKRGLFAGALDPWSGGGHYAFPGGIAGPAVQNLTEDGSTIALPIANGGHHLDLMFPTEGDPESVIFARKKEEEMIRRWSQVSHPWTIQKKVQGVVTIWLTIALFDSHFSEECAPTWARPTTTGLVLMRPC